jgi:RNA polymerase sigma-70 factor (ECF subfamily)
MKTRKSVQRERFEQDALPHLEALWRTALWLTMRRNSAEDLVLRTMAQAYGSWDMSDNEAGPKVRLFKILTSEYFDTSHPRHQPSRFLPETEMSGCDSHQYPIASVDFQELVQLTDIPDVSIKGAVTRLRVQSRLIMILLFRERFSYADIAYITDLSRDSVRLILSKLRSLIPRYLMPIVVGEVTAVDNRPPFQTLLASSDDN